MVRTRLECPQVWQALFTTLSWFQLIKCSQQSWEGGQPSVLDEEAKTDGHRQRGKLAALRSIRPLRPLPAPNSGALRPGFLIDFDCLSPKWPLLQSEVLT